MTTLLSRGAAFAAALCVAACASSPAAPPLAAAPLAAAPVASPAAKAETFEADRAAILAMAGAFEVTFDFRETVAVAPGYALKDPYRTGAKEVIRVIADEGRFISLQHLLIVGKDKPMVVKHWRQDWVYEPTDVTIYKGAGVWSREPVSAADRKAAWSQTVYQVDDSPRYGGVARWRHEEDASTWASNRVWRPLPRRDATKRDDYDVVECVNRHTILAWGWAQEEDNAKRALVEGEPYTLAREVGVNSYVKSKDVRAEVADAYWAQTKGFWAEVRAAWAALDSGGASYFIEDDPEGARLYMPLLALADALAKGDKSEAEAVAEARKTIAARTGPAASLAAADRARLAALVR